MDETDTIGKEYDVLIRCTNGSDINFATRVSLISSSCSYSLFLNLLLPPFPSICIDTTIPSIPIPCPLLFSPKILSLPIDDQEGQEEGENESGKEGELEEGVVRGCPQAGWKEGGRWEGRA
jgi:hypothetical protein